MSSNFDLFCSSLLRKERETKFLCENELNKKVQLLFYWFKLKLQTHPNPTPRWQTHWRQPSRNVTNKEKISMSQKPFNWLSYIWPSSSQLWRQEKNKWPHLLWHRLRRWDLCSLPSQKLKEEIVVLCNLINMSGQKWQSQIETGTTVDVNARTAGNDTSYSCNWVCRHLHMKAYLKLSWTSGLTRHAWCLWRCFM